MKEQINRYARGIFEYEVPVVQTDENHIFEVVDKNREFRGKLRLYEKSGREIKGLIYSSNDQVIIDNNAFSGSNMTINYYVKSDDALDGDIIEGRFNVVSNGGEITIPYSFRIEAGSHDTMTGQVRNLFQFAELAQNNADEALTLFEADDFKDVFLLNDLSLRCVYSSLEKAGDIRNSIEEFLIANRKKKRVEISILDNNKVYDNVEENFKDSLIIEKDTWGYVNIMVHTDSPFIKLERRSIDSDAFTGNRYEFSYVIEASKLHAGKNFGKIIFETVNRKIVFFVTARKPYERSKKDNACKKLIHNLVSLYIQFRTKSIHVNEWIRESGIVIEALRAIDDKNPFYKLALAQLYITEKKNEEAKELIENVKDDVHSETEADYPLYCYFIYVNTLFNKDWTYSKRAAVMIKECYDKYEDWRILWTLLFIDEELEGNPSLKLLKIKEQYNKGCTSPVMYLEACRTFNSNPMLLRVLNGFEINVLMFGAKNNFLDDKLVDQAMAIIETMRNGTSKIVKLILAIWKNFNSKEILETLCRILVRNNCVGEEYLAIYEAGIRAEIKITQLFEYYMMCRNPKDMSPMPKMVLMYFSYNSNLDYGRKAYLYANITHNKTDNPQAYRNYFPQMEAFVKEQAILGHINDHLCILYKNLITPEMVNAANAKAISELFFTYRLTVDNNNFRKVVVGHKETRSEEEYVLDKKQAYVRIYTENPAISFVSEKGNRFICDTGVNLTRLLSDETIIKKCYEADESLDYLRLYYCEKNIKYQKHTMDSVESVKNMLSMDIINRSYYKKLMGIVIDYYYDNYDVEGFEQFFKTVDTDRISDKEITKIIEIRIIQGQYDKAYAMLMKHSAMELMPKRLMKLCSKKVVSVDEPDDRLIKLCHLVFSKGSYDELVLQYLADYYNGSTADMIEVWKAALSFEIDTYDLEERIIAQMMFAHYKSDEITDVFTHYYSMGPKERIVEAYLAYHSYLYFVKESEMPEDVFELIEASLENEKELSDVCKMALVFYYSKQEKLTEFRKEMASKNIFELARKGKIFSFYAKLKDFIKLPYDIADRTMVEYRANPKSRVVIHYVYENREHKKKYVSEDMKQMHEGVFVKQFVLFYGESLQYYISEECSGNESVTDSYTLSNNSVSSDRSIGRYENLNDIIASNMMHDGETFRKLVHTYAVNDYVTSQLFKTL